MENIKKALAKLIHEKDIGKITVSDIIREADISRGTFYAHYSDVHAVVEQIETEEMKNLIDFVERFGFEKLVTEVDEFIENICIYLSRDVEYYRMIAQSNILNNFLWRLVNVYYENLLAYTMNILNATNRDEAELYIIYITSGAKTIILSWLNGEINGTPAEIGQRLGKLIRLNQQYYIK